MQLMAVESPTAARSGQVLPEGLVWVGRETKPDADEIERAVQVLAAVPLAAAAGWSVNGHPWSCHPRRLRTAVVRPSGAWGIELMRGVREVDCLAGPMIVRRSHLDRLDTATAAPRWRVGERRDDPVRALSRALRGAGFRLLLLGEP
jgi:hypothetical protein